MTIATLLTTLSTCGLISLPPPPSVSQQNCVAVDRWAMGTVGVERYHFSVYSDRLLIALRGTQLFERVDPAPRFAVPPTWTARVERPVHGEAMIPVFTFVTLGLVPTRVSEEFGYAFSLTPTQRPDRPIAIEFTYWNTTTMGWWGLFVTREDHGTLRDVYRHPWMHQALASRIVNVLEHGCQPSDCPPNGRVDGRLRRPDRSLTIHTGACTSRDNESRD
jgi:hypothetical protein